MTNRSKSLRTVDNITPMTVQTSYFHLLTPLLFLYLPLSPIPKEAHFSHFPYEITCIGPLHHPYLLYLHFASSLENAPLSISLIIAIPPSIASQPP